MLLSASHLALATALLLSSIHVAYARSTTFFSRDDSHTVDTGYAKYRGNFTEPFSLAFLGVPYAEPPLGDLRFRAPAPLNTGILGETDEVIDATNYPDPCIQVDANGTGSEDCLKVNIYAPVNATSESRLPVVFYVHGGGFLTGNPREQPFDRWINQSPNVVIVSVYYRLGSFGFLTHPDFSNSPIADLNAGIKDQVQALTWVHDNIAAFGGDPDRVTLNGISSGGGAVQLHLVANQGPVKLFSGAIMESLGRATVPLPENQELLFNFIAEQAGCGSIESLDDATMTCLRNASLSTLVTAQATSFTGSLYNRWRPVVDGTYISDYPTRLLAEGKFAHVPVISGATSNDTSAPATSTNITQYWIESYPLLNTTDLEALNVLYDPAQFSSEDEHWRTATGESVNRCGRETVGNAGVQFSKAWTYRYNQPDPRQNNPGVTSHAAENYMFFSNINTVNNTSGLNTVEAAFSEELIAHWLSFVRAGDPNTYKLERSPEWLDFSTRQRVVLQQSQNNDSASSNVFMEEEFEADARRCAFIASLVDHMQN